MKANFGARPFAFAEGQQHREAADEANDLTREIRESFSHLPFNSTSDSEGEGTVSAPSAPSSVVDPMEVAEPLGPPCKTVPVPKPLKGKGLSLSSIKYECFDVSCLPYSPLLVTFTLQD